MRNKLKIILPLVTCGLAIPMALSITACNLESGPVISTNNGDVIGTSENGVQSFKGIPYAAAPIGDLRFAPPQPHAKWNGKLNCKNFGPSELQDTEFTYLENLSEDCLNLNVWKPAEATSYDKLPVYVYIHGGCFSFGSGSQPVFDGANLAKKGIIVVTINYRLNAFGFFCNQATACRVEDNSGEHWTNGNWGILDQILALRWVHDNIINFGGNPLNVTIGGESAGAFSVSSLIVSPAASEKALGYRLFRRAIIESGGVFGLPIIEQRTRGDLATAIKIGEELQDNILGSTVDDQEALTQLRNGDSNMTKALVDKTRVAFENFLSPTTNLYSLMPSFDGYALPLNPVAAFQDPELSQDVDLLVGYNTDEASSWIQEADLPPELFTNWADAFPKAVQDMLGLKNDSDKKWHYIQEYLNAINFQSSSTDKDNYQIPTVRELLDLTAFCAPPIAIMDYMAERKQRANTFVYNFDYRRIDDQFSKVTPCHTAELPFVFGNGLSQDHPGDLALSQHMQDYWVNFMKYGNPNAASSAKEVFWNHYNYDDKSNTTPGHLGDEPQNDTAMWFTNKKDDQGEIEDGVPWCENSLLWRNIPYNTNPSPLALLSQYYKASFEE